MDKKDSLFSSNQICFTTREIASELQVSESLIRFWEKELKLEKPVIIGLAKRKRYLQRHLQKFKKVKQLIREHNLTLNGVKKILHSPKVQNINKLQLIEDLRKAKKELQELISILQ